jgi:hypothetical protein
MYTNGRHVKVEHIVSAVPISGVRSNSICLDFVLPLGFGPRLLFVPCFRPGCQFREYSTLLSVSAREIATLIHGTHVHNTVHILPLDAPVFREEKESCAPLEHGREPAELESTMLINQLVLK